MVSVPLDQLTPRQLLVNLTRLWQKSQTTLNRLDKLMTDLSQSVDDLKNAVDGVAQRLLPEIAALEDALAAARADDADAATIAADAQAAVANIRTEVDRLNALGTDPSTPVDTEHDLRLTRPRSRYLPTRRHRTHNSPPVLLAGCCYGWVLRYSRKSSMMALNAPSSSAYIESRMTRSRSRSGNQSGHFLSTAATTAATEDAIMPRRPMLIATPSAT